MDGGLGPDQIGDLLTQTLTTIFVMSAPVLFTGLVIGFLISIFQAATQINEVTLVFIPKMFGTGVVLWLTGSFIFGELERLIDVIKLILPTISPGGGL
jgi:flagellar biosynthetic protein FliQ